MSFRSLFDSNKFVCPSEHVQCVSSAAHAVQNFYLSQINFNDALSHQGDYLWIKIKLLYLYINKINKKSQ